MAKIDLRPDKLDLDLYAGDGVDITLTITDLSDVPVDLTGTMIAQIRARRNDPDSLLDFDVDLTLHNQGIAVLTLTGAETAELIVNNNNKFSGFWDVQWTPSGAEPRTLCQGMVECGLDVSR